MKRFFKKCLIAMCIVLALSNFIIGIPVIPGVAVYAADDDGADFDSIMGGIVGVLTWIPRALTMLISMGINTIVSALYQLGLADGSSDIGGDFFVTPYHILFNKMEIVNINFFNFNSGHDTADTFRASVAGWYYTMRLLASMILLVILVYVGIRMAISTIAQEKAMYKKMLVDWVTSLALLFLLHYIIQFIFACNDALVGALDSLAQAKAIDGFIGELVRMTFGEIDAVKGTTALAVYSMLVFQTLSFIILYMKRMIIIGFLIIIAPLITITYSIDKMGDQKAQALNNWLKEFTYNILVQPFHCILYLAFGKIALDLLQSDGGDGNIATAILVILCIQFIKDGEKIVKKIFNFETQSLGGLAESAKMATAAMGVGTKAGMAAGKAVGAGAKALSKAPGKLGKVANKAAGKISSAANKIAKSPVGKAVGAVAKPVGKAVGAVTKPIGKAIGKTMRSVKEAVNDKKERIQSDKIVSQMKKNLTEEGYERLRRGQDTPEGADDYKKAREQAKKDLADKKEKNKENRRKITGAVGKGASWTGQKLKMAGNYISSEEGRKVLGGFVAASMGMMGLGDSTTSAINAGQFGYGFTQGLMSTSTRTAKHELERGVELQNNLGTDVTPEHLAAVKANGDGEKYENKEIAKKLQQLIQKLSELNVSNSKEAVGRLNYDISFNPQNVTPQSIEQILKDAGVSDENKDAAMGAMVNFAQFRADAGLYQAMSGGYSVGMDMNDILKTTQRANNSKHTITHEEHFEQKETDASELRDVARNAGREGGTEAAEEVLDSETKKNDTPPKTEVIDTIDFGELQSDG